jgi:hypothetical protein
VHFWSPAFFVVSLTEVAPFHCLQMKQAAFLGDVHTAVRPIVSSGLLSSHPLLLQYRLQQTQAGRSDNRSRDEEGFDDGEPGGKDFERFKGARVPLNAWQQTAVAVGSAVGALMNPARADLVAALGETTGAPAFQNLLDRMKKSPEGRVCVGIPLHVLVYHYGFEVSQSLHCTKKMISTKPITLGCFLDTKFFFHAFCVCLCFQEKCVVQLYANNFGAYLSDSYGSAH